MRKSAFRPRPILSPVYPDLERFDEERRGFLATLGAAVLGSALLAPVVAEAGTPGKKDKKKKKGDKDEPQPPRPGGKAPPQSRLDAVEDAAWREEAARPPKDDKKGKKKQDKKPDPKPRPTRGEAPNPAARIDGDEV
jgi:hypothetical protein